MACRLVAKPLNKPKKKKNKKKKNTPPKKTQKTKQNKNDDDDSSITPKGTGFNRMMIEVKQLSVTKLN